MSSELLEKILSRCSIRFFREDPVPREILEKIIEAGISAPTASVGEQWFFKVVVSPERRRKLHELLVEAHLRYGREVLRKPLPESSLEKWRNRMVKEGMYYAPAYIAAYVDLREKFLREEYRELEYLWAVQSISAAVENMMLAAWSMGLGSVWLGVPLLMKEEFNEVIGVESEDMDLAAIIALGYPSVEPVKRKRKKTLSQVSSFI